MRRDSRSPEAREYRRLYKDPRWCGPHGRRAQQLERQPLCETCKVHGRVTAATVADHKVPHRGDPRLFWEGELTSLCDEDPWRCHSRVKQREEALGYSPAVGKDGWPIDPRHPAMQKR